MIEMGIALAANAPQVVNACKKTNGTMSAVHVSYARRHFTELLYLMEHFRSDIDISGHIIIDVFTKNQPLQSQFAVRILA